MGEGRRIFHQLCCLLYFVIVFISKEKHEMMMSQITLFRGFCMDIYDRALGYKCFVSLGCLWLQVWIIDGSWNVLMSASFSSCHCVSSLPGLCYKSFFYQTEVDIKSNISGLPWVEQQIFLEGRIYNMHFFPFCCWILNKNIDELKLLSAIFGRILNV